MIENCRDLKQKVLQELSETSFLTLQPKFGPPLTDKQILNHLINFPIISPDAIIVVNDLERSTPTARIITLLRNAKKLPSPAQFVIATGTHKPPTPEECLLCTGATAQDKIIVHSAINENDLVKVGETSKGTPVRVNKALLSASKIYTINSIEPHYFAGYTGGVKSIVPGLAARDTTEKNHRWALHPNSSVGRTLGNPVFDDLWEAGSLVKPLEGIISIQLVNHGDNIYYISSGSLPQAFISAQKHAESVYCVDISEKVDRIISFVEPPLDGNLYQAQKAMENLHTILKDGGTFVLVAGCEQGIGPEAFFKKICQYANPKDIVEAVNIDNYQFGDHKAHHWARMAMRAELIYCGCLPAETLANIFMKTASSAQINELIQRWHTAGDRILIDLAGGYSAIVSN